MECAGSTTDESPNNEKLTMKNVKNMKSMKNEKSK
jgi:hypothetical protein